MMLSELEGPWATRRSTWRNLLVPFDSAPGGPAVSYRARAGCVQVAEPIQRFDDDLIPCEGAPRVP